MDFTSFSSAEEEKKFYIRENEDEACQNLYDCKTAIEKYELRLKVSPNKPMFVAKENILPLPFHGVPHPKFPDPWLTVSFKEFTELAKAYAYVLKKRYDLQPQSRVAIMANTVPMNNLLVVALWYLRVIAIEISPKIGPEIKQCWMKMLDIQMCFYDNSFQPFYNDKKKSNEDEWIWNWIHPVSDDEPELCSGKDGIRLICMDNKALVNEILEAKEKRQFWMSEGEENDYVTILGTSSSTQAIIKNGQCSTMKFVPIRAQSLGCKYNNYLRKNIPLESVYYQIAPFHHALGLLEGLFHPQETGGPIVYRTQLENDIGIIPEMILDDLVETNVDEVTMFPFYYGKFMELQEQNHPRWPIWEKMFKTRPKGCFKVGGAAPLPKANKWLLDEFGIHVSNNFGSTETGIIMYNNGDPPIPGEEDYMARIPFATFYLKPLNEADKNIGELYVNSYMCFEGYIKRLKKGQVSKTSPLPGFYLDSTDGKEELFEVIDGKKFYRIRDIFRRSTISGKYKYVSRVDDIITFSTGLKLNPLPFERAIQATCKNIKIFSVILDTTKTEVVCFVEPEWEKIRNENGEYIDTNIKANQLSEDEIKKLTKLAQSQVWESIHEVLDTEADSLANWAKQLTKYNIFIIRYGEKFPMTDKGQASKRVARTKYSEVLDNISNILQGEKDINDIYEIKKEEEEEQQPQPQQQNDDSEKINDSKLNDDENKNNEIKDVKYYLMIIYESLKEHQLSIIEFKDFDPEKSFKYYGVDSLATLKLTKTLSRKLNKSFSPVILFNHGTPLLLAKFLNNESFSIKESESIPKSLSNNSSRKIAIIGMALRLPGAINNENSLWSALLRGKDCVVPLPKDRKIHVGYVKKPTKELNKGEHNIPRFGQYDSRPTVAKPTQFDASFFNCSTEEANGMDVKHRWILETSWEALENAGISPKSIEKSSNTGVFVGVGDEQEVARLSDSIDANKNAIGLHNNGPSTIAGRLSYFYQLYGPSVTIDTACSTGCTALFTACRSMMYGDCDLSIVSAASYLYYSDRLEKTCRAGMTSPNGRCATFDASADGFASSEGCVTYILKRLEDAERDNDNILGVILGISSGQSGIRQSISAPSYEGQARNIKKVLKIANVEPSQVSYVEAHGTGTPLGDAIEIHGLNQVFKGSHTKENPLVVGSIKSNIGHTNEVAGLAGIAKVLVSMKHKIIPKNIHFNKLNPEIDVESIPITIPTNYMHWNVKNENEARIAQVSSFGLQGSIVNVVLQEYKPKENENKISENVENTKDSHILIVSAKNKSALTEMYNKYRNILENMEDTESIVDLCFTSNTGRQHFEYRIAAVGKTASELSKDLQEQYEILMNMNTQIENIADKELQKEIETVLAKRKMSKSIVLVCNEKQFENIPDHVFKNSAYLYKTQPVFMEAIDTCDRLILDITEHKVLLISILLTLGEEKRQDLIDAFKKEIYNDKYMTQYILLSLHYANIKLLESLGISYNLVIGNEFGELVASVLSGRISIKSAFSLIEHMDNWKRIENILSSSKLNDLITRWTEEPESTENFDSHKAKNIKMAKKTLYLCNANTHNKYKEESDLSIEYWTSFVERMLRKAINSEESENESQFEEEYQKIISEYYEKVLSIINLSVDKNFSKCLSKSIKKENALSSKFTQIPYISLYNNSNNENNTIYENIRNLFDLGIKIEWDTFNKRKIYGSKSNYQYKKIILPNYAFQRSRYWPTKA